MHSEHQIKQLKEVIHSSEMMIIEQSKMIVRLNVDLEDFKLKYEKATQQIDGLNEKSSLIQAQKDDEIQILILKTKKLETITNELTEKNLELDQNYQKVIIDLERQLIDAKLQLAQQSSDYEEAKRDVIVIKKQIQDQISSESDKTSNSPNHSLIINEGVDFSTSQFILNDKSMLKDIDITFKNSAIQKNKEFLKNLNAPPSLSNQFLQMITNYFTQPE